MGRETTDIFSTFELAVAEQENYDTLFHQLEANYHNHLLHYKKKFHLHRMNRGLDNAVSKMDVSPTEAFLAEYDYASAVPALSTAPSLGAPQMCQATLTTPSQLFNQEKQQWECPLQWCSANLAECVHEATKKATEFSDHADLREGE